MRAIIGVDIPGSSRRIEKLIRIVEQGAHSHAILSQASSRTV
jgi:hypothetical protein